ncbi:MAG TPA: LPS export ABC transporter permease LptG [Rhodobacteraceae bacterium]|jgi:lipopolysaccharide export system permease protein|nr:LPS export ABC transporter permease LptG [Paracoccaceae bacterium]
MILYRYFAVRFLKSFGIVFGAFAGIMLMLDLVEQIRKFSGTQARFPEILELALLHMPGALYPIMPLIMLLATIMMFLGMARNSELVVTRASGRGGGKNLIAPVAVAFMLGMLTVAALNPIVAATLKQYETKARQHKTGEASILSVSQEGLWLRQGNEDGQTVIHAAGSNLDGTELVGVSFFSFTPDGSPLNRIKTETARLTEAGWELTNAKKWRLLNSTNPERDAERFDELVVKSNLTREQIRDSFGTPGSVAIWDLPDFIQRLDNAGFSARQHRVWFQSQLALPLLFVAMVLIGAGFTMRHTRMGGTGQMVMGAILMGFTLFFIRNFSQVLGENGHLPVLLASWSPPIAAIMLASALILHLEDG